MLIAASVLLASSIDQEVLLHECVEQTEGTDADCEECYYQVYGHYSNERTQ